MNLLQLSAAESPLRSPSLPSGAFAKPFGWRNSRRTNQPPPARRCSEDTWSAWCTWSCHYLAIPGRSNFSQMLRQSSPYHLLVSGVQLHSKFMSLWIFWLLDTCNSTFGIFSACPKKLIVERLSENWIWRTMPLTSFCWAMQHPPWHTAGYSRFPKHPRTRQLQFDIYDFQTKPSSLGPRCNKLCFPLQCQDFVQNSAWMAYGRIWGLHGFGIWYMFVDQL